MNEEKFNPNVADGDTMLIVARLGERKRKLERMAEMEQRLARRTTARLYTSIVSAMAAVVLLTLVLVPLWRMQISPLDKTGISQPTFSDYRSGNADIAEITKLMNRQDYKQALTVTKKALHTSDIALKDLYGKDVEFDDEELVYEEELERNNNSELRWAYIYLLVKLDDVKEARRQLHKYLKAKDYCQHQAEAKALLEEIN
ncbi:hypothetical protein [uncultured Prevotella sp.]|uniref:hypothetical protein n=1 Tax=uncultured Prevotella sp. TaxID=159272 RepID=UPI0025E562A7|nr:hypothetical protein [uncultured Prevotella sp.]